jgi:hypothetical protein
MKALQAAKTSPLVQQCQKMPNDISTWHTVGLFLGPWTFWGTRKWNCQQASKRRHRSPVCWTWTNDKTLDRQPTCGNVVGYYQHPETGSKLISGPSPTPKTRLLSCNMTQSRVVTGLLTVHNTLRKHLYLMGLTNSPLCRKCGAEEETSAHVLWVWGCGFIHTCKFGFHFLGPRGLKSLSLGAIWNCRNRSAMTWHQITGHKGPV